MVGFVTIQDRKELIELLLNVNITIMILNLRNIRVCYKTCFMKFNILLPTLW